MRCPPMAATGMMARAEPFVELWRFPVLETLSHRPLCFTARPSCPQGHSLRRAQVPPRIPAIQGTTLTLPVRDGEWREACGVRVKLQRASGAVLRSSEATLKAVGSH